MPALAYLQGISDKILLCWHIAVSGRTQPGGAFRVFAARTQ